MIGGCWQQDGIKRTRREDQHLWGQWRILPNYREKTSVPYRWLNGMSGPGAVLVGGGGASCAWRDGDIAIASSLAMM
jgi:hypothetical protein